MVLNVAVPEKSETVPSGKKRTVGLCHTMLGSTATKFISSSLCCVVSNTFIVTMMKPEETRHSYPFGDK